jgi:ABC-type phosphate transport system permease subunit
MTMKSAPTRSKTIFNARRQQQLGFSLMTLISVLTVIPIVVVVIYILIQGLPAFSWTFLTAMPSDGMRKGGILPAIIGTARHRRGYLSGRICSGEPLDPFDPDYHY